MAVADAVLAEPAVDGTRDLELAARACRDRILRDRDRAGVAAVHAADGIRGEAEA
jgi:hypothetical protein